MTLSLNPFAPDPGMPYEPIGASFTVTLGKMLDGGREADPQAWNRPYIRAANLQDSGLDLNDVKTMPFTKAESDALDLRRGDILVVEGGAVGTCVVLEEDLPGWSFQKTVNRLRPAGRSCSRYVAYVLRAYRDAGVIDIVCNKSTIPHLTAEKLRALRIPTWATIAQEAIADYLDRETARIDTLIQEQQQLVEMLRERRRAVVDEAFNEPDAPVTRLSRLLRDRPTYGVLVPQYVDEDTAQAVPFVRVGDISSGAVNRPERWIGRPQSEEYRRTVLQPGDVLVGVVGKMGGAAVVPEWAAGSNVARAVAVLRPRPEVASTLLAAWFSSSQFLIQAAHATAGDTVQPTLGMRELAGFEIRWPRTTAAEALTERISKIDNLIGETERFIELARERRAALITAAVTGQIDVSEFAA